MLVPNLNLLKKLSYLIIFFLFLVISFRAFQSHVFTIHFVDEDENIIAGYYMSKGEKLYSDIFSHKQPLPAVMSMAVQKITNPVNLYLLIKRHREVIFFYSVAWTIVLIFRFGFPALIFGLSFETAKHFLLGDLFLGESLAIFPAVYVIGYFWRYYKERETPSILEKFLFSLSLISLCLLLFILIPYAILAIFILLLAFKKRKNYLLPILLSGILGLITTIFFVDYSKYLENTMIAIQTHYLGATISEGLGKIVMYSLFRPLTILVVAQKGDFGNFVKGLSLVYLLTFIYLFLCNKKLRKILTVSFFLLGISSLRYIEPSATLYNGFHGLPWFGLILWVTLLQISEIFKNKPVNPFFRRAKNLALVVMVGYLIFLGKFFINDYYRVSDKERDWYVNFSRFQDLDQTIKELAKPNDKILVLPVEQLIYWQSGLSHTTRFLYGYEWLFVNSIYRQEITEELKKSPPAFIYYDRESMGQEAWDIFDKYVDSYFRIRRGALDTPFFVRKDRVWQKKE